MAYTVYFLKGLPASGKSSYAKELRNKHSGNVKRLNKDLLREMFDFSEHSNTSEKLIISARNVLLSALLKEAKYHIIIDDTNLNPVHEQTVRDIVEKHNEEYSKNLQYTIKVVDMQVSVDECIERDKKRENPVGEEVIIQMARQWNYMQPQKDKREAGVNEYDPNLPSCVIVDVDGTIAHNDGHRDWYDYNKVINDKPIQTNIDIIQSYIDAYRVRNLNLKVFILSGREDCCIRDTEEWISANTQLLELSPPSRLTTTILMRKTGDTRSDEIVKRELYEEHIKGKYNVEIIWDDRDRVVNMWRNEGLRCHQVANGDF
jgi:predicted kinase